MKKSDELRQAIAALGDELQATNDRAAAEGRDLTGSEDTAFNAGIKKLEGLRSQLEAEVTRESNRSILHASRLHMNDLQDLIPTSHQSQPDVIPPRLQAFRGNGNPTQAAADALDCGLWLRATLLHDGEAREKLQSRRGGAWLATQTEGVPADGGYLVPTPLHNGIVESREAVGAIRKLAQIFQMSSATLDIPKFVSGSTVYYPTEAGAITPSDVEVGSIALAAKKRAVMIYMSSELRDDSLISVVDLLVRDMGHQLALREDEEGIAGDGTVNFGSVTGLLPALGAAGVHTAPTGEPTWEGLTLDDFFATMSLIPDAFRDHNQLSWLVSAPFKWQVLDRLALSQGGANMIDTSTGARRDLFLGYPVILSDRMPTESSVSTVSVLFGNFPRGLALGERGGVRVATSDQFLFDTDRIAIRATVRYDILAHELGDASVAGAVVGLATSAT